MSGVAAAVCLLLTIRRPAGRDLAPSALAEPYSQVLAFRYDGALPTMRTAGDDRAGRRPAGLRGRGPAVGLVVGVAAGLGAATRRSAAGCCWRARSRSASPPSTCCTSRSATRPQPGFEWPLEMDRVHPLGWLAILLVVADVIVDRVWQARRTDSMTATDRRASSSASTSTACAATTPGALREVVARTGASTPRRCRSSARGTSASGAWPPAEFERMHQAAVLEHRIFRTMPAFEGAAEALWRLSDAGVWIRIITHRLYVNWGHATAVADTVDWLDAIEHPLPRPVLPRAPSPRSRPTATSRTRPTTSSPCGRRVPT